MRCAKLVIVCGVLLVLSLVFQGCQGGQSADTGVSAPVTSLGGSNGCLLLRYPNGEFYVVHLENNNASKVVGLPHSAD